MSNIPSFLIPPVSKSKKKRPVVKGNPKVDTGAAADLKNFMAAIKTFKKGWSKRTTQNLDINLLRTANRDLGDGIASLAEINRDISDKTTTRLIQSIGGVKGNLRS